VSAVPPWQAMLQGMMGQGGPTVSPIPARQPVDIGAPRGALPIYMTDAAPIPALPFDPAVSAMGNASQTSPIRLRPNQRRDN
jgi:hypothetical protein